MRLLKIIVMIGLTAVALFVAAVCVVAVADAVERRRKK